jgi:hypothetical protein
MEEGKPIEIKFPDADKFLENLDKHIAEMEAKFKEYAEKGEPLPKPYFKAKRKSWTKVYECDYYKCDAHPRGCFFCKHCTDVWFDYTNGPYMFFCEKHDGENDPTPQGIRGKCKMFESDEE